MPPSHEASEAQLPRRTDVIGGLVGRGSTRRLKLDTVVGRCNGVLLPSCLSHQATWDCRRQVSLGPCGQGLGFQGHRHFASSGASWMAEGINCRRWAVLTVTR